MTGTTGLLLPSVRGNNPDIRNIHSKERLLKIYNDDSLRTRFRNDYC